MTLLPTPWPADPVEGEPGHFDHTLWVKASLIALDNGKLTAPNGPIPAGKILSTTGTDVWSAVDPTAVGGVPAGVIVAFHGSTIPAGWAVCDGNNGTPNLQDKFIVGASTTKAAGSSGGQESVTLTAAQSGVPAHTHTTASVDAAHSHDMTDTNLAHSHGMDYSGSHAHGGKWLPWVADQNVTAGLGAYATKGGNGHDVIGMDGSHIHTVHSALGNHKHSILSGNATHSHNVNPNTAADAGQAHSNMPPYYALVYIMKL
jgi:microcystin-dependent protein